MSIELAKAWVERTLSHQQPRRNVCRLLDQASAEGKQTTVLIDRGLTVNGKGWLLRWTGSEVAVLELTQRQQASLGVGSGTIVQHLQADAQRIELPPERRLTLSNAQPELAGDYDPRTPLTGKIMIACEDSVRRPIERCALQVEYFRPDLSVQVTGYWHIDLPILADRRELRFSFPPLTSEKKLLDVSGTVFLFLRMFTADEWTHLRGLQCISNITIAAVDVRDIL